MKPRFQISITNLLKFNRKWPWFQVITFVIIVVAIAMVITIHCICHNSHLPSPVYVHGEREVFIFFPNHRYWFFSSVFFHCIYHWKSSSKHLVVITETLNNLCALPMDIYEPLFQWWKDSYLKLVRGKKNKTKHLKNFLVFGSLKEWNSWLTGSGVSIFTASCNLWVCLISWFKIFLILIAVIYSWTLGVFP